MTFDRCVAVINLIVVVSGAGWAALEWYPTYKTQATTLEQLRINLHADQQVPFEYNGKFTLTDLKKLEDGTHLYSVDYDLYNKNLSKAQITISYSVAELYLGSAGYNELRSIGDVSLVNDPPSPWHPEDTGWVKWNKVAYEASLADGDTDQHVAAWLHGRYAQVNHNGLTAVLPTGTDTTYHPRFVIRAKPDQYVGIVVTFGVDDALDVASPAVGLIYETHYLGDATQGAPGKAVKPPLSLAAKTTPAASQGKGGGMAAAPLPAARHTSAVSH